ncbi:unnamed protein product [Heterobilharzia americana]|nr:unnamed protein product [Heterobilharzia americana]
MHEVAVLSCIGDFVELKLYDNINFCHVIILAGKQINCSEASQFASGTFYEFSDPNVRKEILPNTEDDKNQLFSLCFI